MNRGALYKKEVDTVLNMDELKIKAEIYVSEYLQQYGIQPNLRGYFPENSDAYVY